MLVALSKQTLEGLVSLIGLFPRPWMVHHGIDRDGPFTHVLDGNQTILFSTTNPHVQRFISGLLNDINVVADRIINMGTVDLDLLTCGTENITIKQETGTKDYLRITPSQFPIFDISEDGAWLTIEHPKGNPYVKIKVSDLIKELTNSHETNELQ